MHGDEILGRELLLQLGVALCANWASGNELVQLLLRHTRILLLPSMNPDGAERAFAGHSGRSSAIQSASHPLAQSYGNGRENAHHVDLNRNFPNLFDEYGQQHVLEPETLAVMRWTRAGAPAVKPFLGDRSHPNASAALDEIVEDGERTPFVLGANLHGGALVANYPHAPYAYIFLC